MKITVPPQNTFRYKVCLALFQHGSMTAAQTRSVMTGLTTHNVHQALKGAAETGYVTRVGHTYILTPQLTEYFQSLMEPQEEYVGAIVPRRTPSEFKPMTVTPWGIHADRLRDWSYKNGSTDFKSYVGWKA